jgi:hypothetical protein
VVKGRGDGVDFPDPVARQPSRRPHVAPSGDFERPEIPIVVHFLINRVRERGLTPGHAARALHVMGCHYASVLIDLDKIQIS